MIEAGLYARLVALDTTAEGRVYPVTLPQGARYPALTYQLVSDPRPMTHDGPTRLVEARYQITAYSPVYDEMRALCAEVRAGLHGYTGAMGDADVRRIGYEGGPDLYAVDVGPPGAPGLHHGPRDFLIQYTE